METLTKPEEKRAMNPAVTFLVTPDRVGRHRDVEPFEVALPEHYRATADYLAARIHKTVSGYLMSDDFEVRVDMRKGTFSIQQKRFGGGTFEEVGTDD